MNRRRVEELIDQLDPGWPLVLEWAAEATNPVELLPGDLEQGAQVLLALQVTTRSPMGAIAYQSGGILVEDGWLRILGGGCHRLQANLLNWNGLTEGSTISPLRISPWPRALVVANDAVGGFFAINGGGIEGEVRNVCYFSPVSLEWTDLGIGYSQFLGWAFGGDLADFYRVERWPSWREDLATLPADSGFHSWPPLWTLEGKGPNVSRRAVPMTDLWRLNVSEN
jgi:hypothetical protein